MLRMECKWDVDPSLKGLVGMKINNNKIIMALEDHQGEGLGRHIGGAFNIDFWVVGMSGLGRGLGNAYWEKWFSNSILKNK